MQQRPRVGTPTFHAMSACFLSMSQGRQHLLPTAQTIVRCRCPDSNWRRRPSNSDEWTRRAGAVLAQPLVPQHGAPHGLLGGKQKEGGGVRSHSRGWTLSGRSECPNAGAKNGVPRPFSTVIPPFARFKHTCAAGSCYCVENTHKNSKKEHFVKKIRTTRCSTLTTDRHRAWQTKCTSVALVSHGSTWSRLGTMWLPHSRLPTTRQHT